MFQKIFWYLFILITNAVILAFPDFILATEYTSSSFKVIDPVFQDGGGGEMTSASFKLIGSVGQISVGTSSASSFKVSSGFFTYSAPSSVAAAAAAETAAAVSHGGILESLLRVFNLAAPAVSIKPCATAADFNCDRKVGLTDLSIFLYFAPRSGPNPVDLNKDGVVDAKDFSVFLSSWNEKLLTFVPDSASRVVELRPTAEGKGQFAFIGQAGISEETGVLRGEFREEGVIRETDFPSGVKKLFSVVIGFFKVLLVRVADFVSWLSKWF